MPAKAKKGRTEGMDPIVDTVRSLLEQNVQYFLDNVGTYVEKFERNRNAVTAIIEAQPRLPDPTRSKAGTNEDDETAGVPRVGGKVIISATADESVVEVEFPDNTELKKQLKLLKREAYEMTTMMEGFVDWIDLNEPEKEKGQEDVGAEIQEAVSEQIGNLNDAIEQVYDLELKYLGERSELETTLLAMPEVKSISLSMEIHDSEMWDEVERAWKTMMRVCLIAYNVVSKNIGKLKNPVAARSHAAASMYQ